MSDENLQADEPQFAKAADVLISSQPVLPFAATERQAQQDGRITRWIVYVMVALIAFGFSGILFGELDESLRNGAILIVILAAAAVVLLTIPRFTDRSSHVRQATQVEAAQVRKDFVLDYGVPSKPRSALSILGSVVQLVGGAILGVVVMLALGRSTHDAAIAICGPVMAGIILLFVRAVRPLGVGLILSPALIFFVIFVVCSGVRF